MVGDTGDDVDEDLIGIDENVITMKPLKAPRRKQKRYFGNASQP